MALILKRSKSIGKYSFQDALTFLHNLVSQFDLQNGASRIGLVAYSDQVSIEFDLDDKKSLSSLKNAIKVFLMLILDLLTLQQVWRKPGIY